MISAVLGRGVNKAKLETYREMLRPLNLGLEDKMGVQVGSGVRKDRPADAYTTQWVQNAFEN